MNFANRLKKLREAQGCSVRELATKCNISKSTISMYEKGQRNPKYENLESIADYFNVDIDYLLCRSDVENRYKEKPTDTDGLSEKRKALMQFAMSVPEDKAAMILQVMKTILASG